MEPDDRIALELIARRLNDRVLFFGSTVKNSYRKKALIQHQLSDTSLNQTPVYVGSGGLPEDYTDIASSKAAREYYQEGQGILPSSDLENLESLADRRGSDDLQNHLIQTLQDFKLKNQSVEIILLAPPTDLINVLNHYPDLKTAIQNIHVMGGWSESSNSASGEPKRSTYNVNMDAKASSDLMAMSDIPMILYSSHIIKPNFTGGSVSKNNFPEIIKAIEDCNAYGIQDFKIAALSWDTHLMAKIPALKPIIGDNAGHQFTPADPLVVV